MILRKTVIILGRQSCSSITCYFCKFICLSQDRESVGHFVEISIVYVDTRFWFKERLDSIIKSFRVSSQTNTMISFPFYVLFEL